MVLQQSLSCCHHPGSHPRELQPRGQALQQSQEELNAPTDVWKGRKGCWRQTRSWGLCYIRRPRARSTTLHPLLEPSGCAVMPEHITQTGGPRGSSSVHRPLNPALAAASSLGVGSAFAESSVSCQELCLSCLWLH